MMRDVHRETGDREGEEWNCFLLCAFSGNLKMLCNKKKFRSSHHGSAITNLTSNHEAMSCGKGRRWAQIWCSCDCGVDPIRHLTWEPPYASGAALKRKKRKKKKKKGRIWAPVIAFCIHEAEAMEPAFLSGSPDDAGVF